MSDSILTRIERLKTGKTTKSQRKLLDYFEKTDHKHIIYLSITQLAEETNVAEATVLRFCRSLGFNGYQEFKLNLAQGVADDGYRQSEGYEYITDTIREFQEALENSCRTLSQEVVQKAIDALLDAREINCVGVGHSHLAALELHMRLLKMGFLTSCEQDAHLQNMLVSARDERDVLVIFSVSGGSKDVIEVAELARSCGAKIIVITCYEKSPLARYADIVLSSSPMESPAEPGAMSGRIMQLFVVDVLCAGVYRSAPQRFDKYIAKGNVAMAGKLI